MTAVACAAVLFMAAGPPVAMASDILSAISLAKADVPEFKLIKTDPYNGDIKVVEIAAGGIIRSTNLVEIERLVVVNRLVMKGGVSFGTRKEPLSPT